MAAAAFIGRQHSISAITPDARPIDPAMPTTTAAMETTTSMGDKAATTATNAMNEMAQVQYAQYRSAPSEFPSFERLRLVRLPDDWLPSHLLHRQNTTSTTTSNTPSPPSTTTPQLLQYWPALIYDNYSQLVKDLGSQHRTPKTKGLLAVQHRKFPNMVVARLLCWDETVRMSSTTASNPNLNNSNGGENNSGENDNNGNSNNNKFFSEPKLHILSLPQNSTISSLETNNSTKILNFCDYQFDIEVCCKDLLQRHGVGQQQQSNKGGEESAVVYRYVKQFQKAVDMAVNCMALDLGEDVVTPGGREEVEEDKDGGMMMMMETPCQGIGAAATADEKDGTTTMANTEEEDVQDENNKQEVVVKVEKKKIFSVEKPPAEKRRVENVEKVANDVPPPLTTATSNAAVDTTAVTSNNTSKVVPKNESSTTTTATAATTRGGGTKSRPDASQNIPKKFQSASKEDKKGATTTITAGNSQHPPLPWTVVWKIMRRQGWNWAGGTGLMTGYRYIKPGCKIKGGTEMVDYFNSEHDVQVFARNVYGWTVRDDVNTVDALERVIEEHVRYSNDVVPPLTSTIHPNEPWRDVWGKMRASGWTWKGGTGLMTGYRYIKPGCKIKGGTKGQDYFEREEDVQKFAKYNYGWVGEEVVVEGGDEGLAMMDTKEDKLPEKRRRTEKVSAVDKPATKKAKVSKVKTEKVESIKEDEEEEEEEEEMTSASESDNVDDDDMSRFSEAQRPKKLFVNECADENVPSLEGEQIYADDSWSDVWKKMRKAGWNWKVGSGLMTDYYYIKPGCRVSDGEEGKDYFVAVEDVKCFAERNYGWSRDGVSSGTSLVRGRKRSLSNSSEETHFSQANDNSSKAEVRTQPISSRAILATINSQTKKLSTKKKIQRSTKEDQVEEQSSYVPPRPDPYTWKNLWPALQKDGWRVVKAGRYCVLHDWYYVRPNCDPGDGSSELQVDYFLSEEDVIAFSKQSNYFDVSEESESQGTEESGQASPALENAKPSLNGPSTPQDRKTKPQDPAKPLLSSAKSSFSQSSHYEWSNLWPILQAAGWFYVKASNPLHDWYYVRPNRDPKDERAKLGRHYFTCPSDVIDFVKGLDEKDGKQPRKSDVGGMLMVFEEEATVYSG
ncbi:hypothetical protein ACHAWC_011099 [Mediolabrus comicus]